MPLKVVCWVGRILSFQDSYIHPAPGVWKSHNHQCEEFTRGPLSHWGSGGSISVQHLPHLPPSPPSHPLLALLATTWAAGRGLLSWLCTWKFWGQAPTAMQIVPCIVSGSLCFSWTPTPKHWLMVTKKVWERLIMIMIITFEKFSWPDLKLKLPLIPAGFLVGKF